MNSPTIQPTSRAASTDRDLRGRAAAPTEEERLAARAARKENILQALRSGKNHRQIAEQLGLTRERVRQVIAADEALREAGAQARTARRAPRANARAEAIEARAQNERRVQERAAVVLHAILEGQRLKSIAALAQMSEAGVRVFIAHRDELREAWLQQTVRGGVFATRAPRRPDPVHAARAKAIETALREGKTTAQIGVDLGLKNRRIRQLISANPVLRVANEQARDARRAKIAQIAQSHAEALHRHAGDRHAIKIERQEQRAQAILPGLMAGLTYPELGKLIGVSGKTISRLIAASPQLRAATDADARMKARHEAISSGFARGLKADAIAQELNISSGTVHAHCRDHPELQEARTRAKRARAIPDEPSPRGGGSQAGPKRHTGRPTLPADVIEARVQGIEKGLRDGKKVAQIAQELGLNITTVRTTIHAHLRSLDARLRDERRQQRFADRRAQRLAERRAKASEQHATLCEPAE